ncbi:MAG: dihydrolipoyllysine-residue succinyltransferase [Gammaproteobacteria bacterium CG_4_10_14_0_8_um_filter_38_16]|nr:MAG: dihydrolipoyllysine-residue succinyltransferase [Gammaproteobacteria bacterium CG_4_10_14_0_8_um_filter_38_16]PJA02969.1 MAG: dihydrolipoyllysine-residue succinyltransferase [Gammaproteobacteria bacterium CG_4_10_14_0_2_um_filter_38_22]PJB09435.1 MAG: dihydrolipoyllysine-residue succinyltransferase [Gammaproteobacteria bacterium CG_4_9_14_3_um_filter_38_9]
MTIEIKVPALPESVTDAVIAKWYKKVGDTIARDENLVDLETDKVMLEVPAPKSGTIEKIVVQEGAVVTAGELLAIIREGDVAAAKTEVKTEAPVAKTPEKPEQKSSSTAEPVQAATANAAVLNLSPSARRAALSSGLPTSVAQTVGDAPIAHFREEKRVPMSRLRQKVAQRLKEVQNTAAILTTFNEINMKPVMDLRNRYKAEFEKQTGSRLGFMSFFTKAAIEALKQFPAVNASIDGTDLLYHNYYDIGIAIGSERGLVVPVIRNADQTSMASIEKQIRDYAKKAGDGKIAMEDLMGGTFTITNAGTYGSMMSTPIINPPQSAILGMHNIVERAVVEDGQIVARPMMYVALSYDHRIIDGREAVLFLMSVKKFIEDPARFLLQI